MKTKQTDFWEGNFGKEYTDRNTRNFEEWDVFYKKNWGISKLEMNNQCIASIPKDAKILKVRCNTGMQLEGLKIYM